MNLFLLTSCRLVLLVLFKQVLAEIHDSTNGRLGHRGNLDKVKTVVFCQFYRFRYAHDPDLLTVGAYDTYLRRLDFLVPPDSFCDCDTQTLQKDTGTPLRSTTTNRRRSSGIEILYSRVAINNCRNTGFFKKIRYFVAEKPRGRRSGPGYRGLVGDGGFEPPTSTMSTWRSTPELIAQSEIVLPPCRVPPS